MGESPMAVTSWSAAYTTVSRVTFIDSRLSHRRGVNRELGLVQELPHFLLDTVADGASIDEDHYVTACFLDELVNTLDDGSFNLWVVLRWLPVEVGTQPCGRDPLICYIGGKREIHRPALCKSYPTSEEWVSRRGRYDIRESDSRSTHGRSQCRRSLVE